MFGFGVNKHWILVSNFIDNAFVRNRYAQELAGQLGLANVQMQAVVLILNGICKGVYMLSQHIRIQPEVIDIFDWEQYAEDTGHKDTNYIWVDTDDSLSVTGGFIYEMEPNSEDVSQFVTTGGLHVVINRPEYAFTSTKMMDFAKKTHDGFEKCCQSQYFDDEAGKHYYDYAD